VILLPVITGTSIFLVEVQEKKMMKIIAMNLKSILLTFAERKVMNLLH
jgi:hypothetical protein